jgi:hypothetical protein
VDWNDIYPRLVLVAEGKLRRLRWGRGSIPGGLQSGDFVQQAIQKALSGQRKWDNTKTLPANLWQIISSDISHEVESYENRNVFSIDDTVNEIEDSSENPENHIEYMLQLDRLLRYLGSRDPQAMLVANFMITSDITASKELAILLELSASEIENTKKRLRRLCRAYQEDEDLGRGGLNESKDSCRLHSGPARRNLGDRSSFEYRNRGTADRASA